MKFSDLASSAVSNLARRKVRTVLTSIGVIVGILTIVTMVSLGIGVRTELNKQFAAIGLERLFVTPPEADSNFFTQFSRPERGKSITDADVSRWAALPGAAEVVPDIDLSFGIGSGIQVGDKTVGLGIAGTTNIRAPFLKPPVALAGTIDVPEEGGYAVLYLGALKNLDMTVEQIKPYIGKQINVVLQNPQGPQQAFPLTLLGVSSEDRQRVEVALPDRIAMKSWWLSEPNILETSGYDSVQIRGADTSATNRLVQQIKTEGYQVQSLETIIQLADQVFSVINIMLSSVGGLALLVASLGIVNTMIMSIYERTREIGTLKAIGASRADIRLMFMLEAGMIGLIGGVLGLFFGWGLGRILNRVIQWYIENEQLPIQGNFFVITPTLALVALGFAALVGILAGLYPANRAAKLDPLKALRYE